jgi:hypothetical protein
MLAELSLSLVRADLPVETKMEVIYEVTQCDAVSLGRFNVGDEIKIGEVLYLILSIAAGRMA